MTDSDLSALLWVRSPKIYEDLPRQQLLATVCAGLQPAPHLWRKYLEEIEALQNRDSVNVEEAFALRFNPIAIQALGDVSLGEDEELDPDFITEVRRRVSVNLSMQQDASKTSAESDEAGRRFRQVHSVDRDTGRC